MKYEIDGQTLEIRTQEINLDVLDREWELFKPLKFIENILDNSISDDDGWCYFIIKSSEKILQDTWY